LIVAEHTLLTTSLSQCAVYATTAAVDAQWWHSGLNTGLVIESMGHMFDSAIALSYNDRGQIVHIYVLLSPSSLIWS